VAKKAGTHCPYLTGNGVPLSQRWATVEDELKPMEYRVDDLEAGHGNGPAGVRRDSRQKPVVSLGVVD
jgi:hypothetical protein